MHRDSASAEPEDDVEMSFMDHLRDLRTHIVRAIYGIAPAVFVAYLYQQQIFDFLVKPYVTAWHALGREAPKLHYASVIDPIVTYLKIDVIGGLLLASPWIFYQLWSFISPGLYRNEKRYVIPFVLVASGFFLGGAYFGYRLVLPSALREFLAFAVQPEGSQLQLEPTLMIEDFLDFELRMLLGFGVTFEIPVVVTFLALLKIVNWKQLLSFGRWWVVIASVVAALLTPPDVGSQMLMLVPLIVLYYASVLLAFFFGPTPPKPEPVIADDD